MRGGWAWAKGSERGIGAGEAARVDVSHHFGGCMGNVLEFCPVHTPDTGPAFPR